MRKSNHKIAIIGLGYVGLPLAVEFAKKYPVIGFDISTQRITQLNKGEDKTLEVLNDDLKKVLLGQAESLSSKKTGLVTSSEIEDISSSNIYIVTVPTPIDSHKKPNLKPLISASKMIGAVLKKGDIVIYESTVYPGCTEEDCVPVLEETSGLKFNMDFFCGYSPERVNPGDKINTLTKIKKVTSGSTPETAEIVNNLYQSIITAGTHLAPNMKVAEASKAIENAQRDVNISFMNELALMFERMDIDTNDVIEAAATKWNFLPFKPGLVGGHCIGVDPYYLTYKAESLGYHPAVVSSGRRVNDEMGIFVASKLIKLMIQKGIRIKDSNILILGITFKENCPDVRNTKVVDVYNELKTYNTNVDVFDPWANKKEVEEEFGISLIENWEQKHYEAIVLAVAHNEFKNIPFSKLSSNSTVIYDTKAFVKRNLVDGRL
jgi:UDP-N-acetyl-D-glucosamine/UDP-N-acetyl-D-galactosamine dehydrogenase